MPDKRKKADILLVEDNPGDISLIKQAVAETEMHPEMHVVTDGFQALQYLKQEAPFEDAQKPSIIILDINLPGKDGPAVLSEVKADPSLAEIPVIVFSSSDSPRDISTCYELHANCYVVKPRDLYGMTDAIHCIVTFWLTIVKLPPEGRGTGK